MLCRPAEQVIVAVRSVTQSGGVSSGSRAVFLTVFYGFPHCIQVIAWVLDYNRLRTPFQILTCSPFMIILDVCYVEVVSVNLPVTYYLRFNHFPHIFSVFFFFKHKRRIVRLPCCLCLPST